MLSHRIALTCAAIALFGTGSMPEPRVLPARSIPVPTSVSTVVQRAIAAPIVIDAPLPAGRAALKRTIAQIDAGEVAAVERLLRTYPARIVHDRIAGVPVYWVTPSNADPGLRRRLLVHVHGGAYALFGGFAALREAVLVAHYARTAVLSIDYRMPPDHPYPAALDDTIAVWRDLVHGHDPHAMALFGTSAGGGLTLAAVQKMRALGVPLPAALFAGTPWADLARDDDTQFTNAGLDDVLTNTEDLATFARLYAGDHDLRDPGISPIHGDFHGFPPTILISGTRDLLLSMTVRTHRKLRAAGVVADLNVFEGLSHAQYLLLDEAPESAEAFGDVATFFDRHLAR